MQIGGISPIAQTASVLNPVLVGRSSSSSAAALPAIAKPSQGTSSSGAAPAAAPAKASHAHEAPAQSGGGSAAVQETDEATSFSTTVAGKQYSGSVADSDGTYTASVSNLSGATASGSSAQAAENNLDARIDELV